MPLIDTSVEHEEASAVIRAAGLFSKGKKRDIGIILDENSLSAEDLLQSLGSIAHNSENDSLRLRAIETGLKLNPETRAAMREAEMKDIPIVNIIINDGGHGGINPILIPRTVTVKAA